jgi:hypothetical protein
MVDHMVGASEPRGRVDVRVGVGRRRRWNDEAEDGSWRNRLRRRGRVEGGTAARHLTAAPVCLARGGTGRFAELAGR